MNASHKNMTGKFGIFAVRAGIVACLIQLTSLWLPVMTYKMNNPDEPVFVKVISLSAQVK